MAKRKPKIFVVSSTESEEIRDALKKNLESMTKVDITPWNREDLWRPGHFIVDTLLQFPCDYDFAIAIFGPDDKSISRGLEVYQPRDNVIFEAGMFMSYLGKDRTFVILPKVPPIKILTDLSGLIACQYENPNKGSGWEGALKSTCQKIAESINELGPFAGRVAVGPEGFFSAHQIVLDILKTNQKTKKPLIVKNIALDMELTWPFVRDHLILNAGSANVQWHTLMIDSQSPEISKLAGKAVSVKMAANQEGCVLDCKDHLIDAKEKRRVVFECKVYGDPPILHGFLIDNDTLILNMCNLVGGTLQSASNYIVFKNEPRNEVATDYITVFATWFDHKWKNSPRTVWPNY